ERKLGVTPNVGKSCEIAPAAGGTAAPCAAVVVGREARLQTTQPWHPARGSNVATPHLRR
ncbi:MAG: hypothetical protein NT049_08215, partial [Planctomycetota bacterium]|nr:hypothetical protein [Planctomycetota bacterium]